MSDNKKFNACGIILAGGQSRRMGQDKSLMSIDGIPMIQKIAVQLKTLFPEVIIGANDKTKYSFLNLPIVPDKKLGSGPIMGILSTLKYSSYELNFIIGCDIPDINELFLHKLFSKEKGVDIVMPTTGKDHYEPLFAIYKKSIIPTIEKQLLNNCRRISILFNHVSVHYMSMNDSKWYKNINTPKDYKDLDSSCSLSALGNATF